MTELIEFFAVASGGTNASGKAHESYEGSSYLAFKFDSVEFKLQFSFDAAFTRPWLRRRELWQ